MHTLPGKSGWLRQTPLDRHAQDFLVGADHLVADSDHAESLLNWGVRDSVVGVLEVI